MPGIPPPPGRRLEVWFWLILAAAAALLNLAGGPILTIDSYQYLSAASNLVHSGSLATSLVHFDPERGSGRLPAPLTTLAGGYPILIAALNFLGVPAITGAWLIAALSFVLLVPVFYALAAALQLSAFSARLGLVMLIGNGMLILYSATELTELPFTAVSLGALACLMPRNGALPPWRRWVIGCILAGLSYWIRYAGLFTVASLFLIVPLLVYRQAPRRALLRLIALVAPMLLVGVVMARNILLTGTWQGGNTKHVSNPLLPTLKTLIVSFVRLFWGERQPARFGLAEFILVTAALVLAAALMFVRMRSEATGDEFLSGPLAALCIYAGLYTLGFFYLGLSSVITFGPRMFVPLIPVLLLLAAAVLSHVDKPARQNWIWKLAWAVFILGYLNVQVRELRAGAGPAPHLVIQNRLSEPAPSGQTVEEWLKANVPVSTAVASTQGQETGFAIGRPVFSLVSPLFSTVVWDVDTVHRDMQRFPAKYLILYPGLSAEEAPEQTQSPALRAILAGHLPQWLKPEIQDPHVRVYRCLDCETGVRN